MRFLINLCLVLLFILPGQLFASDKFKSGVQADGFYAAGIAANNYAIDNDAIGVVIYYLPDKWKFPSPPEDYGKAIVEKIESLGEKADFFIALAKNDRRGNLISFSYGNGQSQPLNFKEVSVKIDDIVFEKQRLRERSREIRDALIK